MIIQQGVTIHNVFQAMWDILINEIERCPIVWDLSHNRGHVGFYLSIGDYGKFEQATRSKGFFQNSWDELKFEGFEVKRSIGVPDGEIFFLPDAEAVKTGITCRYQIGDLICLNRDIKIQFSGQRICSFAKGEMYKVARVFENKIPRIIELIPYGNVSEAYVLYKSEMNVCVYSEFCAEENYIMSA